MELYTTLTCTAEDPVATVLHDAFEGMSNGELGQERGQVFSFITNHFCLKPIMQKPGLLTSLFLTIALSTSAVRAGEGGPQAEERATPTL